MFGIGQFFNKFQNAFTKEVVLRTSIKEAIKKHTNIEIPIEEIKVVSGAVRLNNISSGLRSVIFIKKGKILEDIKLSGGPSLTDIR